MPAVVNQQTHRVYLFRFSGAVLVLAFCVIAINYIIDPYDIYPDVGLNFPVSRLDRVNMRLHKPYALEQMRAEHVVIGSSRAASLPPGVIGKHSYNASLPGIWMRELKLMLEHAHTIRPLKSVFIALDYYMFRTENVGKVREGLPPERLLTLAPTMRDRFAQGRQRSKDQWVSLLSVDSLVQSTLSMFSNEVPQSEYLDDGTWLHYPQKSTNWLYSFVNKKRMREFLAESGELDFVEFVDLIDFLSANDIDTTFFLSPFHGSVMNSVKAAQGWKNYLAWQRRVIKKVNASGSGFRVTGIEHNPGITLERIGIENSFYTDGMHFSPEAGKIIMECITVGDCSDQLNVRVLTPGNMDSYLRDVSRLMNAYPVKNPQDFAALQKWLRNVQLTPVSKSTGPPGNQ
jgi:phage pi2 protein 07